MNDMNDMGERVEPFFSEFFPLWDLYLIMRALCG
jgi:hypothetical protein